VKWSGYDDDDNTWEPTSNLSSCRALVTEYESLLAKESKKKEKETKKRKKDTSSDDDDNSDANDSSEEEEEETKKGVKARGKAKSKSKAKKAAIVKGNGNKRSRSRSPAPTPTTPTPTAAKRTLQDEIGRELKLTDNNESLRKAKYEHQISQSYGDDNDDGDEDDEKKEKDWHNAPVYISLARLLLLMCLWYDMHWMGLDAIFGCEHVIITTQTNKLLTLLL
jgi:5'-3' exonuclease